MFGVGRTKKNSEVLQNKGVGEELGINFRHSGRTEEEKEQEGKAEGQEVKKIHL